MLKPWLWLPSQMAHDLAPKILPLAALFSGKKINYRPLSWRGLTFSNPIGIAGGVDKTGAALTSWEKLGAGFIEVGTITPKAQEQNPGVVMARDIPNEILWNKMGFPSPGCVYALTRLQTTAQQISVPLFVNIGKNRNTPNESAADDYIFCLKNLYTVADAFVVNISSPNTKGLRDLLKPESLTAFLKPIVDERERLPKKIPLLLKLSPDMNDKELENCLSISSDLGMDGWIVTNTTLDRSIAKNFPEDGGVSGSALTVKSREVLAQTLKHLG
ncbi:MAG: dihydroorotate dehydrogenase (quinone), partial [Bdellovibrionaceae bacterium]|nr:dihydroorotate dehydrogenase (quinone) [Pseudobdellovibrionaceae bacterium]